MTSAIYRPDKKKLESTGKLELNFPEMTPDIYLASVSEHVRKEFWNLVTQCI